jgi:hypothetical protein
MSIATAQPAVQSTPISQCAGPWQAMAQLCAPFRRFDPAMLVFDEMRPADMPPWGQSLLVHRQHMTRVLAERYGREVDLYVMEHHSDGRHYSRKIFLTAGRTARAVEYGIARLDLWAMSPPARKEILSRQVPLGAVLMRHSALRRIEPLWFIRIEPDSPLARWMGVRASGEALGRIGVIHCDERPAVEVIEIVTNPLEQERP